MMWLCISAWIECGAKSGGKMGSIIQLECTEDW